MAYDKYNQCLLLLRSSGSRTGVTLLPCFIDAANPELGNELYLECAELIRGHGLKVETGQFQADMKVSLVNDGPVIILVDSKKQF